ncbi:MAG: hypothetical protein Q8L23_08775 [Caulobacter sp.]|nr:hypothetical protein [Caulobacter sp.]
MVKPRERRPRPVPLSPEEAAEIEAKYCELDELLARVAAHDERLRREREALD